VDSLGQKGVKARPLEPDSQGDLLLRLGAPAGAEHHPQEVRLDPAHAFEAERAAEIAVLGGEVPNLGPVRLVDDDGLVGSVWPVGGIPALVFARRGPLPSWRPQVRLPGLQAQMERARGSQAGLDSGKRHASAWRRS